MIRFAPFFILLCGLLVNCGGPHVRTPSANSEQSARALERRLMAPCCWRETLDVHSSPVSSQLRAEIRDRVSKGDSPQQIEHDLVARFGPRISAELPETLGFWLVLAACGAGGILIARVARRVMQARQRTAKERTPSSASETDSQYEWQLDQDLLDD